LSSHQPSPRRLKQAYGPLTGEVSLPGDKSITHRAFLFNLLARAPWRVTGWLDSADTRSSLDAFTALGGRCEELDEALLLTPPAAAPSAERGVVNVDCGNSGTTSRLLMGLLAGWLKPGGATVRLHGDASLSSRPMSRVVDPLREMGADISFEGPVGKLPVLIKGAELTGARHHLLIPSAQVKSALQLAGLFAAGPVVIRGADNVRDHTDRMLPLLEGEAERTVKVPADPSAAAFFLVAAALVPGSNLTMRDVSLNPGRTGILAVLRRAGAKVEILADEKAEAEPCGTITVQQAPLSAFSIDAPEVPTLIDELPVLALLAARARGRSVISGAADLRAKECDRIAATADLLESLGVQVERRPDGWIIDGPQEFVGGTENTPHIVRTQGDHRIAMTAAVGALISAGVVGVDDEACVGVSFPEFFLTLESLIEIN
jgi:3-phosphoshikimate 1-carboxyvinyltransferase